MSIQVNIRAPGLNMQASLKDSALGDLIRLMQDTREETSEAIASFLSSNPATAGTGNGNGGQSEQDAKERLKSQGAGELLNHFNWRSYPEKTLLLAAWHEALGKETPWKSGDIEAVFLQAKEKAPGNFPRDIAKAIKSGWLHAVTPRTYQVTRSGWNKIRAELNKEENA